MDVIKKQDEREFTKLEKRFATASKEIEESGFCMSLGTYERTVNGVGAALKMRDGRSVYAFTCSGPAFHFTEELIREQVGPQLAVMIRNIEAELIYQPNYS